MTTDAKLADYLASVQLRAENVRNCLPEAPDAMWRSIHKRSAADVPRLLAALDAVLTLHREFRIYDECGHAHTEADLDAGAAIQTADMVTCQDGYAYSICADCCRDGWGQAEECASEHDHGQCWPCLTHAAITRELLGEENGDA